MINLNSITQEQLHQWVEQAKLKAQFGQLPHYIPLLGQSNPNEFIVYIYPLEHPIISNGSLTKTFPLMSVIKVFSLLYLLNQLGEEFILQRVGKQASEYPFNSLTQLQLDQGFPRNPMINSGAITLASLLPGKTADERCENLRIWLNESSNSQLFLDQKMVDSVRSLPNPKNQALVDELTKVGAIKDPEITLDTYQQICCLSGNIIDLANLGMLLIQPSKIESSIRQLVLKILLECGLYESSPSFAEKIGFSSKSGVSGTLLSIVPEQGVIACYSPPLDQEGNSLASLFLIEQIANFLKGQGG